MGWILYVVAFIGSYALGPTYTLTFLVGTIVGLSLSGLFKLIRAAIRLAICESRPRFPGKVVQMKTVRNSSTKSFHNCPIIEYTKNGETHLYTSKSRESAEVLNETRDVYMSLFNKPYTKSEMRSDMRWSTATFLAGGLLSYMLVDKLARMNWVDGEFENDAMAQAWNKFGKWWQNTIVTNPTAQENALNIIFLLFIGACIFAILLLSIHHFMRLRQIDRTKHSGETITTECINSQTIGSSGQSLRTYEYFYKGERKLYITKQIEPPELTIYYNPTTDKAYTESDKTVSSVIAWLALIGFVGCGIMFLKLLALFF